jgi:hypothetical protein
MHQLWKIAVCRGIRARTLLHACQRSHTSSQAIPSRIFLDVEEMERGERERGRYYTSALVAVVMQLTTLFFIPCIIKYFYSMQKLRNCELLRDNLKDNH